jgi:hypothetical protein
MPVECKILRCRRLYLSATDPRFYGADAIPAGWLKKLAMREFIAGMANALFEFPRRVSIVFHA